MAKRTIRDYRKDRTQRKIIKFIMKASAEAGAFYMQKKEVRKCQEKMRSLPEYA